MDGNNYEQYLKGYDFNAYHAATHVDQVDLTALSIPADGYIIISNEKSLTTTITVQIQICS